MRIDTAIQLFLDHRRRRTPGTRQHYRRWLMEWRDWRAARDLPEDLPAVEIDDFRLFLRYLEDEHIPHIRNPRRPAMSRRGGPGRGRR